MSSTPLPDVAYDAPAEVRRDARLARGKIHLAEGRFHAAAIEFLAARTIDPASFWASHLVGIAYEKSDAIAESVPYFEQALAHSDSPKTRRFALNSLQGVLARLGRVDDALRYAEIMVGDDPADAEAAGIRDGLRGRVASSASAVSAPPAGAVRGGVVIVMDAAPVSGPRGFTLPPLLLRDDAEGDEIHLADGERDVSSTLALLESHGVAWSTVKDVLVLGARDGRRLRWLEPLAQGRSIWATESDADRVAFLSAAMGRVFRIVAADGTAHLPFRDASLAVIDASASFPHLGLAHSAWLLEAARMLEPQGRLVIRAFDERSIARVASGEPALWLARVDRAAVTRLVTSNDVDFASFEIGGPRIARVDFHREAHLRHSVRDLFVVRAIAPSATDVSTTYLLERT